MKRFAITRHISLTTSLQSLAMSILLVSGVVGCGTGGVGGGDGDDDIQYAALGASDATGIGASPLTNGYVYRIKDAIENAGRSTNLMNYGVPDIEIGGIRDVELKLLDAGHTPDIVTLFTGTNDIIAGATTTHFEMDLNAILAHLREIDGVKIFIADLPDLTKLPRFRKDPDDDVTAERVRAYNEIIHRQAAAFDVTVINLSQEGTSDTLVSSDGLHPNDAGYERIANLFIQEILPQLPPPSPS